MSRIFRFSYFSWKASWKSCCSSEGNMTFFKKYIYEFFFFFAFIVLLQGARMRLSLNLSCLGFIESVTWCLSWVLKNASHYLLNIAITLLPLLFQIFQLHRWSMFAHVPYVSSASFWICILFSFSHSVWIFSPDL